MGQAADCHTLPFLNLLCCFSKQLCGWRKERGGSSFSSSFSGVKEEVGDCWLNQLLKVSGKGIGKLADVT